MKLRRFHLIEKIGLILVVVQRGEKHCFFSAAAYVAIMTGCHEVGAQFICVFGKRTELYFTIAQHVGIGRSALCVFVQKVLENPVHVLFGEIDRIIGYAQFSANADNVVPVVGGSAVAAFFLFPIVHEKTDDVVALSFQ